MDIEDYLMKKKDLEKKKELLEKKGKLREEKEKIKKKPVKRHYEESHPEPPPRSPRMHHDPYDRPPPYHTTQWFFLGVAFFTAIILLGIFSMYYFFPKGDSSSDIDDLESLIEDLKENLTTNSGDQEGTEEKEEENATEDEEEVLFGPDFEIALADGKEDDENCAGLFDSDGKISGKNLVIVTDGAYEYRLIIKNKENSDIFCKVDEELFIDEDSDGTIDDTKAKINLHQLKFKSFEEEILPRSTLKKGIITGVYEARCYYCKLPACQDNEIFEEGETINSAKFKIIVNLPGYGNNTN